MMVKRGGSMVYEDIGPRDPGPRLGLGGTTVGYMTPTPKRLIAGLPARNGDFVSFNNDTAEARRARQLREAAARYRAKR